VTTDLAQQAVATPARIGQMTAVEQARAVAEVQAAVVVAQQCPRDMARADFEMQDACSRLSLANQAFYTVPNRGHGPSVHLMRELARIFGNIQYGVHELRRDDDTGESEVQAFAWDVQTNTRSSRTFIVPHARMSKVKGVNTRLPLVDLGDIYLNNQNIGARAVRECIDTILPKWFTEQAKDLCRLTLEKGEGVPLADRITNMVAKFDAAGVSLARIEAKIGRKKGQWSGADLADAAIWYASITREGLSVDEVFPSKPVTADEITGKADKGAGWTDVKVAKPGGAP
jgi:hypothetical protein